MNEKIIENSVMQFQTLLNEIENGRIMVPSFQREYVWSKDKIVKFMNSLINIQPFGTIILWSPKDNLLDLETRNKIVETISKQSNNNNNPPQYLIDGQQRTTSLLIIFFSLMLEKKISKDSKNRFTGWNFGKHINFNYVKNIFTLDKVSENIISLSDIFPEDSLSFSSIKKILIKNNSNLKENEISSYLDVIHSTHNIIKNLSVSIINLKNHNLDEVIEIFSNINTRGTKLNNFDLIHAKWSNLYDESKKMNFSFEENLKNFINDNFDYGYEKIDREIFVDSLYLHIDKKKLSSEAKINHPIKKENSVELIKKFNENLDAFKKAYLFLKGMGMDYRFLPSKVIFKWLTYFYVKTKNKTPGIEADIIKNYIKLSCINDRYASSTTVKLEKDIEFIDQVLLTKNNIKDEWKLWKEKELSKYFEKNELSFTSLENITYSTNSMISNFIKFILYSSTRSFFEGKTHSNDKNVDMHHIFPKNSVVIKKNQEWKDKSDTIINVTPLTSRENKYISNSNPSDYLEKLEEKATNNFNEILKEHGIEKEFLVNDDFEKFIKYRGDFILDKINNAFNN